MRIGFLFNHDQIHQVAHSLPIAMALANGGFQGEIVVATTNARLASEVRRIAGPVLGGQIEHRELELCPGSRRLDGLIGALLPAAKLLVYRDNIEFFRSLDLLVVAEKTSLLLKKRYGLDRLKIVHTRHGAGDRAIGFDRASAGFDHVLCSGPKIRCRLIAEAGLDPASVTIVGYPKFDLLRDAPPRRTMPNADRTVLYNPHASPHLSSWYRHGRAVFDLFAEQGDWELIFAPHVMLFERSFVVSIDKLRVSRAGEIARRHLRGGRIRFDLGSRASTDMTYTSTADVYLGDVSSQVYEFLHQPRPCIFLNSHDIDWRGDPNYLHWTTGEVLSDPAELPAALDRAQELHRTTYRAVQEDLFAQSFDLTEVPSSVRAAEVLSRLAGLDRAVPRIAEARRVA